jgi:hypothetical protein
MLLKFVKRRWLFVVFDDLTIDFVVRFKRALPGGTYGNACSDCITRRQGLRTSRAGRRSR